MKLFREALILFLGGCAVGQAAPAGNPQSNKSATIQPTAVTSKIEDKTKAAITADTSVITVPNLCDASAKDCKTVVTRKQFESTLLGLSGGKPVPPDMPRRFASQYGEMLVFANEAQKRGFDKEAETDAALHYAWMQVLATRYLRTLQEQSQPTDEEIQKYYDSNPAQFQAISLDRLMIPTGHAKSKKPEELKALADDMRKRLVAGEDASKLQQDIYTALNLSGPPKTTAMIRKDDPEQEALTTLKVGEVSEVITEPMALLVYRSQGQKPIPLDRVRDEIQGQVYQQKLQAAVNSVIGNHKSVLNDAYFSNEAPKDPHQR